MKIEPKDLARLVVSLVLPLAAGAVGGIATASSVSTWYPTLIRPSWTPPDWLFGPVWTLLYILMGIALWLVWRGGIKDHAARIAVTFFGIQLGLNLLWSVLFFGLRSLGIALIEIIVLWVLILLTAMKFYRLKPPAGWLMSPYLLWVTFATALNAAIWWLNR